MSKYCFSAVKGRVKTFVLKYQEFCTVLREVKPAATSLQANVEKGGGQRQVLLRSPMKKLQRPLARLTSHTAGGRIKEHLKNIRIMAGNMPRYFPTKHLKQIWMDSHTLRHPKVLVMQKSQHWTVSWSGPSENQGWKGLEKWPILFFLPQVLIFPQVPAQQQSWGSSLCSLPAMHPNYLPRQAGTGEMLNQGSSSTANTLHLSLGANSGRGFCVYLLFQVLCKAFCLLMWQPGGPCGCSVQGQPANRPKTENLCTKRLLLPRTIERDWNMKEFLVTLWGRERIIC